MFQKTSVFVFLPLLLLVRPDSALAQTDLGPIRQIQIQVGAGFEYFGRTAVWDEGDESFKLKSMLFTLRPSLEINQRIAVEAVFGYTLSNYGLLTFRDLPLSLELDLGNQDGWMFGGGLEAALWQAGDFEIGVEGEYVYFNGKEDALEIPGLPVRGEATAAPDWQRLRAGLRFTYVPYAYFYPYARVSYDRLWGRYEVGQEIADLSGSQERNLEGRGKINAGIGLIYWPFDRLTLSGELTVLPHSDGVDLGMSAGVSYRF
jgi:hypothetical protein